MEQLPNNPSTYEAKGMSNKADCPSCKKEVITFNQMVSTMPQDEKNQVRKYVETFCAYCGTCIKRETVDETIQ